MLLWKVYKQKEAERWEFSHLQSRRSSCWQKYLTNTFIMADNPAEPLSKEIEFMNAKSYLLTRSAKTGGNL